MRGLDELASARIGRFGKLRGPVNAIRSIRISGQWLLGCELSAVGNSVLFD
jgi:plasmid maintenance system killer protein